MAWLTKSSAEVADSAAAAAAEKAGSAVAVGSIAVPAAALAAASGCPVGFGGAALAEKAAFSPPLLSNSRQLVGLNSQPTRQVCQAICTVQGLT